MQSLLQLCRSAVESMYSVIRRWEQLDHLSAHGELYLGTSGLFALRHVHFQRLSRTSFLDS